MKEDITQQYSPDKENRPQSQFKSKAIPSQKSTNSSVSYRNPQVTKLSGKPQFQKPIQNVNQSDQSFRYLLNKNSQCSESSQTSNSTQNTQGSSKAGKQKQSLNSDSNIQYDSQSIDSIQFQTTKSNTPEPFGENLFGNDLNFLNYPDGQIINPDSARGKRQDKVQEKPQDMFNLEPNPAFMVEEYLKLSIKYFLENRQNLSKKQIVERQQYNKLKMLLQQIQKVVQVDKGICQYFLKVVESQVQIGKDQATKKLRSSQNKLKQQQEVTQITEVLQNLKFMLTFLKGLGIKQEKFTQTSPLGLGRSASSRIPLGEKPVNQMENTQGSEVPLEEKRSFSAPKPLDIANLSQVQKPVNDSKQVHNESTTVSHISKPNFQTQDNNIIKSKSMQNLENSESQANTFLNMDSLSDFNKQQELDEKKDTQYPIKQKEAKDSNLQAYSTQGQIKGYQDISNSLVQPQEVDSQIHNLNQRVDNIKGQKNNQNTEELYTNTKQLQEIQQDIIRLQQQRYENQSQVIEQQKEQVASLHTALELLQQKLNESQEKEKSQSQYQNNLLQSNQDLQGHFTLQNQAKQQHIEQLYNQISRLSYLNQEFKTELHNERLKNLNLERQIDEIYQRQTPQKQTQPQSKIPSYPSNKPQAEPQGIPPLPNQDNSVHHRYMLKKQLAVDLQAQINDLSIEKQAIEGQCIRLEHKAQSLRNEMQYIYHSLLQQDNQDGLSKLEIVRDLREQILDLKDQNQGLSLQVQDLTINNQEPRPSIENNQAINYQQQVSNNPQFSDRDNQENQQQGPQQQKPDNLLHSQIVQIHQNQAQNDQIQWINDLIKQDNLIQKYESNDAVALAQMKQTREFLTAYQGLYKEFKGLSQQYQIIKNEKQQLVTAIKELQELQTFGSTESKDLSDDESANNESQDAQPQSQQTQENSNLLENYTPTSQINLQNLGQINTYRQMMHQHKPGKLSVIQEETSSIESSRSERKDMDKEFSDSPLYQYSSQEFSNSVHQQEPQEPTSLSQEPTPDSQNIRDLEYEVAENQQVIRNLQQSLRNVDRSRDMHKMRASQARSGKIRVKPYRKSAYLNRANSTGSYYTIGNSSSSTSRQKALRRIRLHGIMKINMGNRIRELHIKITKKNNHINFLQEQLEIVKLTLQKTREEKEKLKSQTLQQIMDYNNVRKSVDELKTSNKSFQNSKDQQSQQYQQMKQETKDLQNQIGKFRIQNKELNFQLEAIKAEKHKYLEWFDHQTSELEQSFRDQLEDKVSKSIVLNDFLIFKQQLHSSQQLNKKLQASNNELRTQNQQLMSHNENISQENSEYRNNLQQVQQSCKVDIVKSQNLIKQLLNSLETQQDGTLDLMHNVHHTHDLYHAINSNEIAQMPEMQYIQQYNNNGNNTSPINRNSRFNPDLSTAYYRQDGGSQQKQNRIANKFSNPISDLQFPNSLMDRTINDQEKSKQEQKNNHSANSSEDTNSSMIAYLNQRKGNQNQQGEANNQVQILQIEDQLLQKCVEVREISMKFKRLKEEMNGLQDQLQEQLSISGQIKDIQELQNTGYRNKQISNGVSGDGKGVGRELSGKVDVQQRDDVDDTAKLQTRAKELQSMQTFTDSLSTKLDEVLQLAQDMRQSEKLGSRQQKEQGQQLVNLLQTCKDEFKSCLVFIHSLQAHRYVPQQSDAPRRSYHKKSPTYPDNISTSQATYNRQNTKSIQLRKSMQSDMTLSLKLLGNIQGQMNQEQDLYKQTLRDLEDSSQTQQSNMPNQSKKARKRLITNDSSEDFTSLPINDRGFSNRLRISETEELTNRTREHLENNENSRRIWVAKASNDFNNNDSSSINESDYQDSYDDDMDHIPINLTNDFLQRNKNQLIFTSERLNEIQSQLNSISVPNSNQKQSSKKSYSRLTGEAQGSHSGEQSAIPDISLPTQPTQQGNTQEQQGGYMGSVRDTTTSPISTSKQSLLHKFMEVEQPQGGPQDLQSNNQHNHSRSQSQEQFRHYGQDRYKTLETQSPMSQQDAQEQMPTDSSKFSSYELNNNQSPQTRSLEQRKLLEQFFDEYRNAQYDDTLLRSSSKSRDTKTQQSSTQLTRNQTITNILSSKSRKNQSDTQNVDMVASENNMYQISPTTVSPFQPSNKGPTSSDSHGGRFSNLLQNTRSNSTIRIKNSHLTPPDSSKNPHTLGGPGTSSLFNTTSVTSRAKLQDKANNPNNQVPSLNLKKIGVLKEEALKRNAATQKQNSEEPTLQSPSLDGKSQHSQDDMESFTNEIVSVRDSTRYTESCVQTETHRSNTNLCSQPLNSEWRKASIRPVTPNRNKSTYHLRNSSQLSQSFEMQKDCQGGVHKCADCMKGNCTTQSKSSFHDDFSNFAQEFKNCPKSYQGTDSSPEMCMMCKQYQRAKNNAENNQGQLTSESRDMRREQSNKDQQQGSDNENKIKKQQVPQLDLKAALDSVKKQNLEKTQQEGTQEDQQFPSSVRWYKIPVELTQGLRKSRARDTSGKAKNLQPKRKPSVYIPSLALKQIQQFTHRQLGTLRSKRSDLLSHRSSQKYTDRFTHAPNGVEKKEDRISNARKSSKVRNRLSALINQAQYENSNAQNSQQIGAQIQQSQQSIEKVEEDMSFFGSQCDDVLLDSNPLYDSDFESKRQFDTSRSRAQGETQRSRVR